MQLCSFLNRYVWMMSVRFAFQTLVVYMAKKMDWFTFFRIQLRQNGTNQTIDDFSLTILL